MANIYGPPYPAPKLNIELFHAKGADSQKVYQDHQKAEEEYVEGLRRCLKTRPAPLGKATPYLGEILRFPFADGYAIYMVANEKPLNLWWLKLGDGWRLPEYAERGLTLKDVKQQIDSEREYQASIKARQKIKC